jgi:predicted HTH domain antitoxin
MNSRFRRRWTIEDNAYLIELYRSGKYSRQDIAKLLGRTVKAVEWHIWYMGIAEYYSKDGKDTEHEGNERS